MNADMQQHTRTRVTDSFNQYIFMGGWFQQQTALHYHYIHIKVSYGFGTPL